MADIRRAPQGGEKPEPRPYRSSGFTHDRPTLAETLDSAVVGAIEEVRRVATETLRVGPHCVSILISRFIGRPQVRVRYHPHGQHLLLLRDGPPVPVAFTPWLIGPDGIAPPSLAVGGAFGTIGRLDVSIEVPEVPESSQLKALYQSQDRPAAPGRLPGLYSRPDD
jgi:hypothetical protein